MIDAPDPSNYHKLVENIKDATLDEIMEMMLQIVNYGNVHVLLVHE